MNGQTKLRRLSRLRHQLVRLKSEAAQILEVFLARDPMLAGTVYELRRKCGRPTCRCARGELHPATVLTWSEKGRKRLRVVTRRELAELRVLTQRYRRFRKARARLVKLDAEMLSLIDQTESLLKKEG